MYMPFESYYISDSDFGFYKSLPDDEKLIFLHDLICSDYYQKGSDLADTYDISEYSAEDQNNIDSDYYRKIISTVLDQAIDYDSQVNIIFINEIVVFNSYSKRYMSYAILDLSFDGVLLEKLEVPKHIEYVFKKQDHYQVFKVIDVVTPILPKNV